MPSNPVFDRDRLAAFARRLDADVASGAIPGAALLIGGREADLFAHEAGFRDIATRAPLRADAIWRIYSMTKPIVTMAGLVLMERGLLTLDQPIADFIPAFAELEVALPDGRRVPAEHAPTIQDLMRHTAGITYGFLGDSPAQRAAVADGFLMRDLANADYVARLARIPLEHQPGRVWHYSHATDVLGHVLEVAMGCDLAHVLDDTLLAPLGMRETWFAVPPSEVGRVAEPLPQAPGQRPLFFDPRKPRRGQRGNHGLFSTMADQACFLRMMLCDGRLGAQRVLSGPAIALATSDHLGRDIARAAYYPPGPGYGFGLGFAVRLAVGEAAYPGSVGDYFWSGVGGTYFWVDPARGFFAILMMQTSDAAQRAHYRALARAMVYAALE
ncbi:hypothetical protein RHAL1_03157 [Beijerinckiaceae bacterium RH AL1]|nr:serine hydrolase [Beijerinckiaceae bacterium]VVB48117.1 hypothetical protein RHCH11_RHCH11_03093 [Beijerinckiaceae bacterium RH CH11]VVB48194.1 hypothetical protein RHAL8_03089 [Beijerinckiaceae bacterium RH AL8]VVC56231.1 hypothetical protein RHAL1_03157 [Beijerinckiaceae bacterium RH AL1]